MACQQCAQAIAEKPPFCWLASNEMHQFVMFGLEGAGKTTLLYKLKIPSWKREDIKKDLAYLKKPSDDVSAPCGRDPSYHYEEMRGRNITKYGIWEIPGNETLMRLWPIFYRYLRITCVIFVVDAFSEHRLDLDRIAQARHALNVLLNEDELRGAAFYLILNVKALQGEGRRSTADSDLREERAIYDMLGGPEIEAQIPHKGRFRYMSVNCADFTRDDPEWENALKEILKIHRQVGYGSVQ